MPDTDTYGGTGTHTDPSTDSDPWLTPGEAARFLGVSVSTLQRWDRDKKLVAHRTLTNQRRYRRSALLAALPS